MATKTKNQNNELTFASVAKLTNDELEDGIVSSLETGRKAYREVCMKFVQYCTNLKSEAEATARLKKKGVSVTNLANAKTLYRCYERLVGGGILTPDPFFDMVNFSLAVAINSIFFRRTPTEALEIVKSRIGTTNGVLELLYIQETGETYDETAAAKKAKVAKAAGAPATATLTTTETTEKSSEGSEASENAATGASETTEKIEKTVKLADPIGDFETALNTVEEIAGRLISTGIVPAETVRSKLVAMLATIDAAIEAVNLKAA